MFTIYLYYFMVSSNTKAFPGQLVYNISKQTAEIFNLKMIFILFNVQVELPGFVSEQLKLYSFSFNKN